MPELEQVVIQQTGLRLNENEELSPPGSLKACKNISLQKQGVYSSRRGFQWILNPLLTVDGTLTLREIKHTQPFHDGLLIFTNEGVYFADADDFSIPPITLDNLNRLGDSTAPSLFFEQDGVYFRESNKMKKIVVNRDKDMNIAEPISSPINATLNKPPAPRLESLETEGGWLRPDEAVAYRTAWIRETVDGLTYRSAPSERLVVKHTETTETDNRSPRFIIIPPVDAQEGDKLEVYRSLPVTVTAGVGTPSDALFLISTEEYAETIDYTDSRSNRGTLALYTNSTQENVASANTPPPQSEVVYSSYYGMTLYGDVTETAAAVFDLEADLVSHDTFAVKAGTEQTFVAITNDDDGLEDNQFLVVAGDRVKTLENLVFSINSNSAINPSVIAYVIEAEGRVSLGIESLNKTTLSVKSSSSAWSPSIKTTQDDQDIQDYPSHERHNRLVFSKAYEPVSVPSSRYLDIGEETARIIALAEGRGELYVFKEDGIFRITGQTFEDISVRKIGNDIIAGPNAVSLYKNEVYAICNTGVNRIVYENIQEISQDIIPILRSKSTDNNFNLSVVFGDDNERQLFVALAADKSATSPSEIYVFNFQTGTWTQWEYNFEEVFVYGGRLMFSETNGLHWEKRQNSSVDYSDLDWRLNIRASGTPFTNFLDCFLIDPSGVSAVDEGRDLNIVAFHETGEAIAGIGVLGRLSDDKLNVRVAGEAREVKRVDEVNAFSYLGDDLNSILTVYKFENVITDVSSFYAYLSNTANTEAEIVEILRPIFRQVHYHDITQGGPTILKLLSCMQFIFNGTDTDGLELGLATDTSSTDTWYPLEIERSGLGFGLEAYGIDQWGGSSPAKSYKKISVPREYRRHYHLGVKWRDNSVSKSIELLGFSLSYEPIPQEEA